MNQSVQIKTKVVGKSFYLAARDGKLVHAHWKPMAGTVKSKDRFLERCAREIRAFVSGKTRRLDLPIALEGTDFQKRVWKELRKIPRGKTASYRDIAKRVGSPRAVRAVGSANARNPICIVVPCHRVITSSGELGGYAGGMALKKRLLELERN
jgi:methylated-DNA-[protein]-cysteine S-methyltransferase